MDVRGVHSQDAVEGVRTCLRPEQCKMWDPQGPAFGRAVKIPVFHAVLSGFDTWLWLPVQPPPNGATLEAAGGSSSTWVRATHFGD